MAVKMKLGEEKECVFKDRIAVEFSPAELERLRGVFRDRALSDRDYGEQGEDREIADRFDTAHRDWEAARRKKDRK